MALVPAILEIGTGIDLHGQAHSEAGRRAVWNAVQQSSLMFLRELGPDAAANMIVDVLLATPDPDLIDEDKVLSVLPHGKASLQVVKGGLEIEPRKNSGDKTIVANAAVVVRVEMS